MEAPEPTVELYARMEDRMTKSARNCYIKCLPTRQGGIERL